MRVTILICDLCEAEAIPGASLATMLSLGWETAPDGRDLCPTCALKFPRTR